jgi:DNA-binding NtrC family response regulator
MNPKPVPTGKVLIVEENKKQRILLESILDDNGFQIISEKSGEKAIKFMRENGPVGVIFAPCTMKEMNGLDFFKIAKNISCESYRVLLSCYHDIDNLANHIEEEVIHYFMRKPFLINEVIEQAQIGLLHYSYRSSNTDSQ